MRLSHDRLSNMEESHQGKDRIGPRNQRGNKVTRNMGNG